MSGKSDQKKFTRRTKIEITQKQIKIIIIDKIYGNDFMI